MRYVRHEISPCLLKLIQFIRHYIKASAELCDLVLATDAYPRAEFALCVAHYRLIHQRYGLCHSARKVQHRKCADKYGNEHRKYHLEIHVVKRSIYVAQIKMYVEHAVGRRLIEYERLSERQRGVFHYVLEYVLHLKHAFELQYVFHIPA